MAVAGCGVRSSGVITGNAAPSGPAEGVTLYLVLDGKLSQVLRATSEQLTPEQTLNLLAAGPDPSERTRGFSSAVPGNIAPVTLSYGQTGQATPHFGRGCQQSLHHGRRPTRLHRPRHPEHPGSSPWPGRHHSHRPRPKPRATVLPAAQLTAFWKATSPWDIRETRPSRVRDALTFITRPCPTVRSVGAGCDVVPALTDIMPYPPVPRHSTPGPGLSYVEMTDTTGSTGGASPAVRRQHERQSARARLPVRRSGPSDRSAPQGDH
ncbi:hypothetical protein [Fodinicola feengrottensis]|uniref:hypothetical protein n=1 Tax=Fodinicola feengrottensis TaxID=435914 RepID=UPI0024411AE1|nr:hypothetical protein [Fodinicola feengrottensis]